MMDFSKFRWMWLLATLLALATSSLVQATNLVTRSNDRLFENVSRELMSETAKQRRCYAILAATADNRGRVSNDRYYYFVDGMSNGYFSGNEMDVFGDLPVVIKYSFVTLACQCRNLGRGEGCCEGDRAHLDVTGADPEGPEPNDRQKAYLNDICVTTEHSIGDKIFPPSGELPVAAPTESPESDGVTVEPTRMPVSLSSAAPTKLPSSGPIETPSRVPTARPSSGPVVIPTMVPTVGPTVGPSRGPTAGPSGNPTAGPTGSSVPSGVPSWSPTSVPSLSNVISDDVISDDVISDDLTGDDDSNNGGGPGGDDDSNNGGGPGGDDMIGNDDAIGNDDDLEDPDKGKAPIGGSNSGGLSGGAWAGIAIGTAAVGTLLLYCVISQRDKDDESDFGKHGHVRLAEEEEDGDAEHGPSNESKTQSKSASNAGSKTGPQLVPISPTNCSQDDTTATAEITTALSAARSLDTDEEATSLHFASEDDASTLFSSATAGSPNKNEVPASLAAMGVNARSMTSMYPRVSIDEVSLNSSVSRTKSGLPPRNQPEGELDQAIETGNWEAVAASAAAIVNKSTSHSPLSQLTQHSRRPYNYSSSSSGSSSPDPSSPASSRSSSMSPTTQLQLV